MIGPPLLRIASPRIATCRVRPSAGCERVGCGEILSWPNWPSKPVRTIHRPTAKPTTRIPHRRPTCPGTIEPSRPAMPNSGTCGSSSGFREYPLPISRIEYVRRTRQFLETDRLSPASIARLLDCAAVDCGADGATTVGRRRPTQGHCRAAGEKLAAHIRRRVVQLGLWAKFGRCDQFGQGSDERLGCDSRFERIFIEQRGIIVTVLGVSSGAGQQHIAGPACASGSSDRTAVAAPPAISISLGWRKIRPIADTRPKFAADGGQAVRTSLTDRSRPAPANPMARQRPARPKLFRANRATRTGRPCDSRADRATRSATPGPASVRRANPTRPPDR